MTVGDSAQREYVLLNRSGVALPWKIESPQPWITFKPAGGSLAPGADVRVAMTIKPATSKAEKSEAAFTVSESAANSKQEIKVTAVTLLPYKAPAGPPPGTAVDLETVSKALLKSHVGEGGVEGNKDPWFGTKTGYLGYEITDLTLVMGKDKKAYPHGLWVRPSHETVYKLEGSGYTAFSALVGITLDSAGRFCTRPEMGYSFEVYVDGEARVQTGIMKTTDEPRLIVVDNLAAAKELKLVTRLEVPNMPGIDSRRFLLTWAEPKLYKK